MLSKNKISKNSWRAIIVAVFFVFSFQIVCASEISSQNVIRLVNLSRAEAGLAPLTENKVLAKIANEKAQDMLDKKYFAHTSPDGLSPWYWFEKEKYDYKYAGENLAIDFVSVEIQHNAWMGSEKHRQNILSNHYSEIGVAVAAGKIEDHMTIFTVQVFGTPAVAGKAVQSGENFSAEKRSVDPAFTEGRGMVLASKNVREFNSQIFSGGKRYVSDLEKSIQQNKKGILDISFSAALVMALLVLVVNPLVFISKSWENIYHDLKKIRQEKFSRKEPAKDLFKMKPGLREDLNNMDVIKLNKFRI